MSSPSLLTAADFKALGEGPPWFQLMEGLLVHDPAPTTGHQQVAGALHALLRAHVLRHRLGKVFIAPLDVYLSSSNVFEPDVLFVSNARAHRVADDGIHGAPDLAVEILSPSSATRDRTKKRRIYATAGTLEYWIVDPKRQSVEVHDFSVPAPRSVRILGAADTLTSPLIPGLRILVRDLFLM